MKKATIISLSKTKKLFKPAYVCQEYEKLSVVTVKNKKRAIDKVRRHCSDSKIIISHSDSGEKIWDNKYKCIKRISYKTALPVLEKICRQMAQKHNMKIPFGDIYIAANPVIACAITTCLYNLSRIFTVISVESPLSSMYDELYFKHGTIIRHLPEFNNNITEDSIIIRCDADELQCPAKIPMIDFSEKPLYNNLTVVPAKIFVSDENIALYAELWGGKSGLEFFEAMGEIPGANAHVDINKASDEIFLLDTDGF